MLSCTEISFVIYTCIFSIFLEIWSQARVCFLYHLIIYYLQYNWYHKKACLIVCRLIPYLLWLCNYGNYSAAGYEWRSEIISCRTLIRLVSCPVGNRPWFSSSELQRFWTLFSTQCFARFHFWLEIKTSCSVLSMIS